MTSSEAVNEREIVNKFNVMRAELQRIAGKIVELETDRDEHTLVIKAMEPLDGARKSYRLINGVLVERTVDQVLPELKTNVENLSALIMKFAETAKTKEQELKEFTAKYKIRVEAPGQRGQQQREESNQQNNMGLLV